MAGTNQGVLRTIQILSAVLLLATGVIHIVLVFAGTGGFLGVAFTLNAVAGLVLAIAVVVLHGRLLQLAAVLGLLFLIATLGALLLALTVSLFGIRETWGAAGVPQAVIVESIGIVVLAALTWIVLRGRPAVDPAR